MRSTTSSELLEIFDSGGVVLLPNSHAVAAWRQTYAEYRSKLGGVWLPAAAFTWPQWTANVFSSLVVDGHETRLLLNDAQEHDLWRAIVESESDMTLTSPDTIAELAKSAFRLAAAHQVIPRLKSSANSHETASFARWSDTFRSRCRREMLLSTAELDRALTEHLSANVIPLPQTLHVAGFLDITPSQRSLREALEACDVTVIEHQLVMDRDRGQPQLAWTSAQSPDDELTLVACALRDLLWQEPGRRPRRIGVVVPTLDEDRGVLEARLRDVLTPHLRDIAADPEDVPWDFASGATLASTPLVRTALAVARWAGAELQFNEITRLLLSPYLGGIEDRETGVQFDVAALRHAETLRPEASVRTVLQATAARRSTAPAWLRALDRFLHGEDLARGRSFADWAEFLRKLLRAAGWPGQEALTRMEQQAVDAFDAVLDVWATLDVTAPREPLTAALQSLERLVHGATLKTPDAAQSIQVMRPEETLGTCFDAAFFLRATDENWPPRPTAHPFLSWTLQRELTLSGSSTTDSEVRARRFLDDLMARSGSVLFSCAREDADNKLRPSQLLAERRTQYIDATPPALLAEARVALDPVRDEALMPPLASPHVRGGATVLKLQASCGFRAFAELRLRSLELESLTLGYDAREAGSFLHTAMQRFWSKTRSQASLRAMSPQAIEETLTECIEASLPQRSQAISDWDKAYLRLQKDRLHRLMRHWMRMELDRAPFEVVATERNEDIAVGPLQLRVRMDRVDQVEGGVIFIDYKTGASAEARQWDGDRPEEPQLPLYSLLASSGDVKGLTFARIRPGKQAKWVGIAAEEGLFEHKSVKLDEIDMRIDEWRATLTRLAQDFAAGRASVDPRDFTKDCPHCAQRLLCRFDPAGVFAADEAEDNDG